MSVWRKLLGIDREASEVIREEEPDFQQVMNVTDVGLTNNPEKEDLNMLNEQITSDNLSAELLKSVFDAAFMEATLDEDGEIVVKDAVSVRVRVNMEQKDRIRFTTVFGFKDDSSPLARLECVNRINIEYILICASVQEDLLLIRYDLWVQGGIEKKALVMALKRFATIPYGAVADHGQGVVE